jgi:hypothetical protein
MVHEVIEMKDIRGLNLFDSMIVSACMEEEKVGYHRYGSNPTRRMAKTQARLKWADILILGVRILVSCLLLNSNMAAYAQSTFGSVRGIVQDNTGAVIADSQVVLHSVDENTERTVTADGSGTFIFENVTSGG